MTPTSPGPVPGPPPGTAVPTARLDANLDGDLAVLDTLAERPLEDHVAVYGELHTRLQAALNEIDSA